MRTSTEIFAENLRNMLIARNKKQADLARFTAGWKDVYAMLDEEHRRVFWRNIIKAVRIDENAQPVEIMY